MGSSAENSGSLEGQLSLTSASLSSHHFQARVEAGWKEPNTRETGAFPWRKNPREPADISSWSWSEATSIARRGRWADWIPPEGRPALFTGQCTEHCFLTGCPHPPECHRPSVTPPLSKTSEKLATSPKKLLYEKQAWLTGMRGISPIKVDLLNGGDTSQSQSPFFYSKMLIKSDVCPRSETLRFQGQPSSPYHPGSSTPTNL